MGLEPRNWQLKKLKFQYSNKFKSPRNKNKYEINNDVPDFIK